VLKDSVSNPDEDVAAGYVVSSLSYFLHLQLVALAGRTMTVPLSHSCHLPDLSHINKTDITNSIRNQYSPWCVSMMLLLILTVKNNRILYVEGAFNSN
jgi:hypothetical protein